MSAAAAGQRLIQRLLPAARALRHDLHAHPEVSGAELETVSALFTLDSCDVSP